MSEQDFPPQVPPVQPAATTPVAPSVPPQRKSRAWMWWTLGIVLALALLIGSCTLPLAMLLRGDQIGGDGFGNDSIAVIYVDGVIAGTGDYYSGYVTPEYFKDLLDQAEEDDSVKAIVLRVDSPGGTAAASEEISRYVKAAGKPVVVSVGDVDASGAYMISSQADEIWAMPASAVGSIGVITEIPNVEGLLDQLGIEFQVITSGKYKDAGSPWRSLTK
ncbi:MAG: S49 family peptidase, partial [Actinobacteria bacterium]